MKDKIFFAKMADSDEKVGVDVDILIEHRMQILANSGSGKSHIARAICENAQGMFQQIVISPKKEFVSLREKFPYLHVGKSSEVSKPDIELNTRYAGQLAIKLLEVGKDVVIEFSQFPQERVKWLRNFVEGLMSAPEHLWHPVMIMIDEIDIWAPEKGHGEAESLQAIVDLAARGRDKGFFLIGITQKLSKFNKDVASELDIKLVGKVSLDNDQTRAAQELGIPQKEKGKLRWLGAPNYYFYAFGPGLSDEIIKIQSLPVQTTHISGYKRNKNYKPIPTPDAVKAIIAQFSDLPQEAEKELKTKDDLLNKIKQQSHEIATLKRTQPKIDPKALEKAKAQGFQEAKLFYSSKIKKLDTFLMNLETSLDGVVQMGRRLEQMFSARDDIKKYREELKDIPTKTIASVPLGLVGYYGPVDSTGKVHGTVEPWNLPKVNIPVTVTNDELKPSEIKVLEKILQRPDKQATKKYVALRAGYAVSGGGFGNILGKLRKLGYINYAGNEMLVATQQAIDTITNYAPLPTDPQELVRFWIQNLGSGEGKVLKAIAEAHPNSISRADVAEATGYSEAGGGYGNILGKLRTLGLIEYLPEKMLKASNELMGVEYA